MRSKLTKFIAMALVLLLSAGSAFAAVPGDVQGQSYEAAVSALMEKGIITGDISGNFNPDSVLTRAQACMIIVKSMNPPAAEVAGTATQPAAKSGFSDMNGYGWADGYVAYAVLHGVTKGYPDGTFKPGNSVTMNELITMVLRAAAYTDNTMAGTWPDNYLAKAKELELLKGTPDPMPVHATKWIAAQVDFNALASIEKANPQKEEESSGGTPVAGVPDTASMTYIKGSFSADMKSYNGKPFAEDLTIYAYGKEASYSSAMAFSKKAADYKTETVYKYKNVETPAFYAVKDGKIVAMVVPKDVGFSGLAYVVINGTIKSTNASGDAVTGLATLAAGNEIKWLCEKDLTGIPNETDYMNGILYEIKLVNGTVKAINTATPGSHKGDVFDEISGSGYVEIADYSGGIVEFSDGEKDEIKDNATIYVIDSGSNTKYKVGKQSDIKDKYKIRVYDMSDDNEISGDIVIVKKN